MGSKAQRVLLRAGWEPGRQVDTTRWRSMFDGTGLEMHEAAERFLREFGGLSVEGGAWGLTSAREPFVLDPELVRDSEEGRFLDWSAELGRPLFPIGELDHGRFFLGIDDTGEIYLVETWLATFGRMPEALDNLILGVKPRDLTPS